MIIWSHVCESKYHQFRSPGILYFCNVIVHICIFQLQVILDGPTVFQLNMSNWCSFKLLIICFRWIFYGLFVLLHCNSEGYFFAVIVIFILACLDVENEKKCKLKCSSKSLGCILYFQFIFVQVLINKLVWLHLKMYLIGLKSHYVLFRIIIVSIMNSLILGCNYLNHDNHALI